MDLIRYVPIRDIHEASSLMEKLGVDPDGIELMKGKTLHLNLKVEGIDPKWANLLKQEMLSLDGDAALDRRTLDCSISKTDVLLMGTQKQFERLVHKLEAYPSLQTLSHSLAETLKNLSKTRFTLRCRKKTFLLGQRTLLMGILNVTPDSFSDGGLFFDRSKAIEHGLKMAEEGADLIDIGGESTRPGSKPLDPEEELRRVIPVIKSLAKRLDIPISIDTYKSKVAKAAIDAGAELINDISGLHFDPELAKVASQEDVPIVLMHIRGTPETMQKDVHYESLFSEILQYLREGIERAESSGVDPEKIIIDPGIGFGKTLEHNLLLIKNLSEFRILGKPILLGTSRKSFIGRILNAEPQERLEGTLASTVVGILHGAHIVRCHDVAQAKKAIAVADAIRGVSEG